MTQYTNIAWNTTFFDLANLCTLAFGTVVSVKLFAVVSLRCLVCKMLGRIFQTDVESFDNAMCFPARFLSIGDEYCSAEDVLKPSPLRSCCVLIH